MFKLSSKYSLHLSIAILEFLLYNDFCCIDNDSSEKYHLVLNLGGEKMPNIKSAIKRVKTNEKANQANSQAKSAMRTAIKKAEQAIIEGSDNAKELVVQASRALDKGVTKGIIHKNAAARKKSRLAQKVAKAN